MAFQPCPDIVEIVFDWTMSGAATANVLHFYRSGGYNQVSLDALVAALDSIVPENLTAAFTLTQAYVGVRGKGLGVENDIVSSSGAQAFTGTEINVALPNNVALCLTLRSALTGRSARGRWFTQPPHDGQMASANMVLQSYATLWIDFIRAMINYGALHGWTPIVLSRQTNGAKRAAGVGFPITSVVARNLRTDSQRGRMPVPD